MFFFLAYFTLYNRLQFHPPHSTAIFDRDVGCVILKVHYFIISLKSLIKFILFEAKSFGPFFDWVIYFSGIELFIIARTWKQPRCPSADEWIRKLWYIYTMECYSAIKKNTFESVLMRWMKLELIIQSEVSQKEKHQYSILTHIYGI